ncbi:GNAT family N-acetyltransferase [Emcibacter sp. SYSU 3D8]|uniref:GNAT family N-acetyltransferase n=1 Tax=Emcibacter sp. SYSU 3D8 TaxID=3133969 RepID=UPI0031FEC8FD
MIPARWRPMNPADIAAVDAIAAAIHMALPEQAFVFAERQRLYPDGCFILEMDGDPAGYVISHPWYYLRPPSLNVLVERIPDDASTYYIHDLALLRRARRTGAGSAIVRTLVAHAHAAGLPNLSLIAVYDAAAFWRGHGFQRVDDPALTRQLAGYGAEASMMVRPLQKQP